MKAAAASNAAMQSLVFVSCEGGMQAVRQLLEA